MQELRPLSGVIKWSENASIGYCPQNSTKDFDSQLTVFQWMEQWRKPEHDEQAIRGVLGRMLFSADELNKKVQVCSGGEKNRLLFGKLILQNNNVLIMDEPTNHLDMESIEALNLALEHFSGTLIFVSHDREFVSSLATRIVEIRERQCIDFHGTYDEYLAHRQRNV